MLVEQVYVFLGAIITGAILGLVFDIFRAFRINRHTWYLGLYSRRNILASCCSYNYSKCIYYK